MIKSPITYASNINLAFASPWSQFCLDFVLPYQALKTHHSLSYTLRSCGPYTGLSSFCSFTWWLLTWSGSSGNTWVGPSCDACSISSGNQQGRHPWQHTSQQLLPLMYRKGLPKESSTWNTCWKEIDVLPGCQIYPWETCTRSVPVRVAQDDWVEG